MPKNLQKLITFSPDGWESVEKIQAQHGFLSSAEAVRYAVAFTFKKENPAYVLAEEKKHERIARTPEEKASEKVEIQSAILTAKEEKEKKRQEDIIENGARICRELRGKETKDASGNRKCVYHLYQFTNPKNASIGEKTLYLDELSDNDIETQYMNTITNEPCPADQVIATLVDLGLTDNMGEPI